MCSIKGERPATIHTLSHKPKASDTIAERSNTIKTLCRIRATHKFIVSHFCESFWDSQRKRTLRLKAVAHISRFACRRTKETTRTTQDWIGVRLNHIRYFFTCFFRTHFRIALVLAQHAGRKEARPFKGADDPKPVAGRRPRRPRRFW